MVTKTSIPRRSSQCVHGGETLGPGCEYVSLLVADERKDFCPHCWEKLKERNGNFWKGKIPPKKEKELTPDEKALALFRTLEDPKVIFVLALYLERKKQLVRCPGKKNLHYELPETGEVFSVEPVLITPSEGERILAKLNEEL